MLRRLFPCPNVQSMDGSSGPLAFVPHENCANREILVWPRIMNRKQA